MLLNITRALPLILSVFCIDLFAKCDPYDVLLDYKNGVKRGEINIKNLNYSSLGPTRDQGKAGYCFAYAGADMLEHWLKATDQMPKDENISGVALGLSYEELQYDFKSFKDRASKRLDKLQEIKEVKKELEESKGKRIDLTSKLQDLEAIKGPDYDVKKKELNEQFKKIISNIDKLEKTISDTFAEFSKPLSIPEGGVASRAIRMGYVKGDICYESEVSSNDSDLEKAYLKHKEELESMMFTPKNNFSTQNYLLENVFGNFDGGSCAVYDISKAMFPAVTNSQKELLDFLKNESIKSKNPLLGIMRKYCTKKKSSMKRPIVKAFALETYLKQDEVADSRKLMIKLNQNIKKGKAVGVHYSSKLFYGLGDKSGGFAHVSTVVGDAEMCGNNYFILRNSWGQSGCLQSLLTYEPEDYPSDYAKVEQNKVSCDNTAKEKYEKKEYDECLKGDSFCKKRYDIEVSKCAISFIRSRAKTLKIPFICDDDGNFIIDKNYFRRGLARVEYIENY